MQDPAKAAVLARLKKIREDFRASKLPFESQYQRLIQYFYQTKKSAFPIGQNKVYQGEFLNDGEINDNIGAYCAQLMSSAIMGSVWKGERGTVQIVRAPGVRESRDVLDYFVKISRIFSRALENKKSRFESTLKTAIDEYVILGTAGQAIQRGDYSTPLRYQEKSVLFFYVGFDEDGNVNRICFDKHLTAQEIVAAYGLERVPGNVAAAITRNDYQTRFVVSELIEPRDAAQAGAGALSMPWAVYEFMPNESWYFAEGGYESFPIPVMFCDKLEYESYGRSYAMRALPTVVQIQIANEILAEGGEGIARPTLGMYDNGTLAGRTVDLSAGALNVFNVSGSVPTDQPVFPLYTVGDMRVIMEWLKLLYERCQQFFLIDKLYDLNSQQRMTIPEVSIRDAIRANATNSLYVDVQNFMVAGFERSMDILFSMGLLGVKDPEDMNDPKVRALIENGHEPFAIPEAVWEAMERGLDWYEFEFITPAARVMRSEAFQAAATFIRTIGEASQFIPGLQYTINEAGTAKNLRDLLSADMVMVNSPEEVAAIKKQVAEAQAQLAQLEAKKLDAQANQSNAQAAAAQSGALRNMQSMSTGQEE